MAGNSSTFHQPLLDRLANELQPVRRLWPVRLRLSLLVALETTLLLLLHTFTSGIPDAASAFASSATIVVSLAVSFFASSLALREAVPGRGARLCEMTLLGCACVVAAITMTRDPLSQSALATSSAAESVRLIGWIALPAAFLFLAARRGVVLMPMRTGLLIAVTGLAFGVATDRFVALHDGAPCSNSSILSVGLVLLPFAILTARQWLDPRRVWDEAPSRGITAPIDSFWLSCRSTSPVWLTASLMLLIAIGTTRRSLAPASELDLAVDGYQRAITSFIPNVPSNSVAEVLTAYVEHGMPSYMWDFGPDGFKLVGGRLDHLPDGTPVSFTLFRKDRSGVMCVFRPISGFVAPMKAHDERNGMLFYRYRGYSVCLINLGNYGSFASLIVSPLPLRQFENLVVAAAH